MACMLMKCETKSSRVKGVAFHPTLQWCLTALHNGAIQLWDYRVGSLVDRFEEHEVRIWNWQSRVCMAVLTGHTHYVMCARFHPTEDLVVSASLDQTLRLWDTSGLRERSGGVAGAVGRSGSRSSAHGDIFAATDAVCKFVLEGHERGANWAAFHPSMPLIASAADDKLIKLWRYNSVKAWEVDTLRGHSNNVSCLVFHPHRDLLISDSEDRTIRVWDVSRRTCLHTFRRDMDRFWVLAAHPTSGAIAAGHDGGMVVFKLTTERPPACMWTGHELLYVSERRLCWIDTTMVLHQEQQQQQMEVMLTEVRRPPNALANGPKQLLVNPLNTGEINAVVVYTEGDGLSYDFLCGPRADGRGPPASGSLSQVAQTAPSVSSLSAHATADAGRIEPLPITTDKIFFAGPNRLILLGEDKLYLYDIPTRRLSSPLTLNIGGPVRTVTWAPDMHHLALTSKHSVVLLRANFSALSSLSTGLAEKEVRESEPAFKVLSSLHENIRVKGGVWDPELGGFFYATLSHVKFCMTNGDKGIVCSLSESIYIVTVAQQQLLYMDRRAQLHCKPVACNDYLFKVALSRRDYMKVALLVRYGGLCGNSLIGYLKEKGYSEVALEFLSDRKSKFLMALEVGRMDEALEAAKALNDKAGWRLLGDAAMQEGCFGLAEICFQKLKAFEKLSFLYLLLGDRTKLKKMLHVSKLLREPLLRQHQALLLGDAEERVDVFMEAQQPGLAYLCAKTHGLDELAEQLRGSVDEKDVEEFLPKNPVALFPPVPIMRFGPGETATWKPAAAGEVSAFAAALRAVDEMDPETARLMLHRGFDTDEPDASAQVMCGKARDWGEGGVVGSDEGEDFASLGAAAEGEWKDAIDIGVEDDAAVSGAAGAWKVHGAINGKSGETYAEAPGADPTVAWRQNPIPSDLVVAGDFTGAIQMLRRRLGLLRVAPLEPIFQRVYESSWAQLKGHSLAPPLQLPLVGGKPYRAADPPRVVNSALLLTQVREAHKLVTGGKFAEALTAFRQALLALTLAVAQNQEEEQQLLEMLDICRTYIIGMRLETSRLMLGESDAQRNLELVAYFSCCRLQPSHSFLVLRRAMSVAWKAQNFITAASFARRLLSGTYSGLKGAPEELAKAKRVLLLCEQKGTDAININYEPGEAENILLCTSTMTRLNPGTPVVRCGFCGAVAQQQLQGSLCRVCEIAELGARVVGIQFLPVV
ncbi:coatomer alpha subunit, putative [Eimeria tenella]|uniref:Coatomer alpha subunit, putative n=1 Tax=Eimeria tenella TaxID=5802 RepID=U6KS61_EIMTE|nr:coatomer alpha subunit, putative [Eimeria tenella]CDJ39209.1 coatomer alpha subunit, putative [Eimeria tenella]|eukprot:XP_013229964.1 coatomer alpha subunit, putative [Eimeria tenella]